MPGAALKFGIPDLELRCASGAAINPSSFAGHELIVLFAPLNAAAAARELADYRDHSSEFVERDAWLLAFAEDHEELDVDGGARILTLPDPHRRAWVAFQDLASSPLDLDRRSGATFLFTRGGNLHHYWSGPGHVGDLLVELQTPSAEHEHQQAC